MELKTLGGRNGLKNQAKYSCSKDFPQQDPFVCLLVKQIIRRLRLQLLLEN